MNTSKFDKDAWLQEKQEKMKNTLESIERMALEYKDSPGKVIELLLFRTRFYKYSLRNTMLIYSQNPGATYVQSFAAWQKEGCHIKKGAKGMKVLVPVRVTFIKSGDKYIQLSKAGKDLQNLYKQGKLEGMESTRFTLGNVFDISQTDFPKERYPELYQMGYPSEQHAAICIGLEKYSKEVLHVPVKHDDVESISIRGYYKHGKGTKEIVLSDKLEDTQRLSVLSHELGHALLIPGRDLLSTAQNEFEADAISIMLQEYLGVEITESRKRHLASAFKQLGKEGKDIMEVLQNVGECFQKARKEIQPFVDRELGILKETNKEFTRQPREENSRTNLGRIEIPGLEP